MLTLQLWYASTKLRELCERAVSLLPAIGVELLCEPAEKVDMGMVASWEVVRALGKPLYLGLTEAEFQYGVVTLFTDSGSPKLIDEFESALARVWTAGRQPLPAEAFLVRGMDDSQGPMFVHSPITSKLMSRIRVLQGEPGDRGFAPQIRVIGPALAAKIGAGSLEALARSHVTTLSTLAGSVWLDFSWTLFRPAWRAP